MKRMILVLEILSYLALVELKFKVELCPLSANNSSHLVLNILNFVICMFES